MSSVATAELWYRVSELSVTSCAATPTARLRIPALLGWPALLVNSCVGVTIPVVKYARVWLTFRQYQVYVVVSSGTCRIGQNRTRVISTAHNSLDILCSLLAAGFLA